MITATAQVPAAGVTVAVGPGGGLRSISLNEKSMRLGGERLAGTILSLVRNATAQANQRARLMLPDADLDALGLDVDAELVEAIEMTTPDVWMR